MPPHKNMPLIKDYISYQPGGGKKKKQQMAAQKQDGGQISNSNVNTLNGRFAHIP